MTKLGAMTVGDPLDEATDIGAIINETQFRSVQSYLDEGLRLPSYGVALGGTPPESGPLANGYFHCRRSFPELATTSGSPTRRSSARFSWPSPGTTSTRSSRWPTTRVYGLAAYVWSKNLDQALTTAHRIEAGWVQVNQGGGQVVGQSYGGYKQSGIGREVSLEGMLAGFTQIKQINVRLRG